VSRSIIAASLCALLLTGCAYFNTFYNAKKQFNTAEKAYRENPPELEISGSQREMYEQAIKKASKILVFYPESKYVDDALFLMGKAYFRMEEFGKSRRKFEELLANYPQSKFRFEAGYLLGTIHYYSDDQNRARDALAIVIDSPKKNAWADNARFTLGEMAYWNNKDYKAALEEYARLSQDYPNSEMRAKAVFMMGECQFQLENYQDALAAYQEARRFEFSTSERYKIEMRIGECFRKANQYDDALKVFNQLAGSDRYVDRLPEIRLRTSELHYLMGDTAQALEGYEDLVRQNEKTQEAAWAYYQMGLMHMEGLVDLEKAKELFEKSKAESPTSEAAKLASLKRGQINRLEEYRQKAAQADSTQLAEAYFSLAEVYFLDLGRPDSALVFYRKVIQETPLSKYAPQSSYVAAWIVENSMGDTAGSRQMYQDLIDDYPLSESANVARQRLGQPALVDSTRLAAMERLGRAEELLLKENDPDGALAQYRSLLADLPDSPLAPKAECAIAWTLEHMKGQRDSALAIYERLAAIYPNTQCGLLAQQRTAPKPASTPAVVDTTAQTVSDTTLGGATVQEPLGEEEQRQEDAPDEDEERPRRRSRRRPPEDEPPGEQ
jgi:TolA-binding protein